MINESMRRHNQIPVMNRICTKAYKLPLAKPDLEPYMVKPGEVVWISTFRPYLNPKSKFYQNPKKFDPERYLIRKVGLNDVTHLRFGVGSRSCVGNKFATLEMKIVFFFTYWQIMF